MGNRTKCCLCGTSTDDILNLGELKSYENIHAHYYCLLLSSTIKQSGADHEGILGFLPSDIQEEVKNSQKRICYYCKKKGASIICSAKGCKVIFHLPCGIANETGHQFYGSFLSNCKTHRPKQKYQKPKEPQTCPICYESVNFKRWRDVLAAPCCKKKSYFHKKCIQQMALSAGYFFKCPMCNNSESFQKTMKHFGVFIPDRDASWELEPNAFEELLYRHEECNVKECLCKSGRTYNNLGNWFIVLCNTCGSQGTHLFCSKLKKDETWLCERCLVDKNAAANKNPSTSQIVNEINLTEPSTSGTTTINSDSIPKPTKKRKRSRSLRSSAILKEKQISYSNTQDDNYIEIDSEDSDVVVIDDEPNTKCLIAQDGSLLKVRNIPTKPDQFSIQGDLDIEQQENTSCENFMNLVITDVRSLSETVNENIPSKSQVDIRIAGNNKTIIMDVSNQEFNKLQNKIFFPVTTESEPQLLMLQEVLYNKISIYKDNANQNAGNSNSSESDIVIID